MSKEIKGLKWDYHPTIDGMEGIAITEIKEIYCIRAEKGELTLKITTENPYRQKLFEDMVSRIPCRSVDTAEMICELHHKGDFVDSKDTIGEYNFEDYSKAAMQTCLDTCKNNEYAVLGLTSEAGEVAGLLKKFIRGDGPLDTKHLIKECGDVLWYLNLVLVLNGSSLKEAAIINNRKLADRKLRGAIHGEGDDR